MNIKHTVYKYPRQEQIEERIQEILDEFDFDEIQTMMKSVDWRWADAGNINQMKLPSVDDLYESAERRLREASKDVKADEAWSSSGGFTAIYRRFKSEDERWFRLDLHWGKDTTCWDGIEY